MSFKFRLRPLFAPFVLKMAKIAVKFHLTPNGATFLMFITACIATTGLFVFNSFIWFGIWIFITGLLDGVDGAIARITKKTSQFGAFYDSVMDRFSETVIFIGLFLYNLINFDFLPILIACLIILGFLFSFLISYTRARADVEMEKCHVIDKEHYSMNIGLLGRSERLFYLVLMSITVQFTNSLIFLILISIFVGLTVFTFFQRLFTYKKYLTEVNAG